MSAVNYDLMLQQMLTKTKGEVNQFIYWSRPLDWKNQTLTPNPDAIYFMTFFNTKDVGPMVIEVPPAEGGSLAANIDDVWQAALEDAGPEGADKGRQILSSPRDRANRQSNRDPRQPRHCLLSRGIRPRCGAGDRHAARCRRPLHVHDRDR
jgi:hypothetical protein